MNEELSHQLRGDEAIRTCVYLDSRGFSTIGIGRLVDGRIPGAGLRPIEIEFMLQNDIADRINQLTAKLPWFAALDHARQGVLLNMSFQMGVEGLLGFHNTLAMVESGDYSSAADGMMNSTWAHQTPNRAARLSKQMLTGIWQYAPGT
jgi:lysozyme